MKISIITITFNSEKTLEDTIRSVQKQNFEELEYIVVDGGSTDGTLDIIKRNLDIITKWISEPDKGISDAFNKGISLATGDIIGIINSDDMLYPDTLRRVAEFFEINKKLDVLHGNTIRFSEKIEDGYVVKPNPDLRKMKYTFLLNHPSVFVAKKAYQKYGTFMCDYKTAMDYELLSRMYYQGAMFLYEDEIFSCFRDGGISKTNVKVTLKEHRQIALRNGATNLQIDGYFAWLKIRGFALKVLKKMNIELLLRRVLKRQKMVDSGMN